MELKRIELWVEFLEMPFGLRRDVWRSEHALEWGLGCVVVFDDFRFDALLYDKLYRREEEVHEQRPLMSVEFVESWSDARIIEAIIAEVLPDDGPVLPFNMGVVIFVILTGAGVLDRSLTMDEVLE